MDQTTDQLSQSWYMQRAKETENAASSDVADKMAQLAALGAGVNPQLYDAVKQEFQTNGVSQTYDMVQQILEKQRQFQLADLANATIKGTSTFEEKQGRIDQLRDRAQAKASMRELATDSLMYNSEPLTGLDLIGASVIENQRKALLKEKGWVSDEVRRLVNERGAGLDSNLGKAGLEFIVSAFLPGFQLRIGEIHRRVSPETFSGTDYLLAGNSIESFRKMFFQLEEPRQIEVTRLLLQEIKNISPNLIDNSVTEWEAIQDFLGGLDPSSQNMPVEKTLLNIFGVLDVIPLLGTAGRVMSRMALPKTRITQDSAASRLASVAPKDAETVFRSALETENEQLANSLGVDLSQIAIDTILPKASRADITVNPDLNLDDAYGIEDVLNHNPLGLLLTEEERRLQKESLRERIAATEDALEAKVGHVHLSKTTIEDVGGALEANFVVAANASQAFPTYDLARKLGKAYVEVAPDESNMRILKRDFEDDTYKVVDPNNKEDINSPGEFLVQVKVREPFDYIGAIASGFKDSDFIGYRGRLAAYMTNSSVFSDRVRRAINAGTDRQPAIERALGDIMQPFNKLNRTKQSAVMAVLNEEDQVRKEFKRRDVLTRLGGDYEAYRGYLATREMLEVGRKMLNRHIRPRLQREGQKALSVRVVRPGKNGGPPTEEFVQHMGRPLDEPVKGITAAYDPVEGKIVRLTDEAVEALYAEGKKLYEAKTRFRANGHSTDHIIYTSRKTMRVSPLPFNVVKKIPGYLPRAYDAAYIVGTEGRGMHNFTREPEGYFSPVSLFANRGEAEAEAELRNLNARLDAEVAGNDAPGDIYKIKASRELERLDPGKQLLDRSSIEYLVESGQLFFSPRGEELKPLQETVLGSRSLKGVADSLDAARATMARHLSVDPLVENLYERLNRTYGQDFGIGGKVPLRGTLPKNKVTTDAHQEDRYRQAVAMRDRIAMIAGIDEGTLQRNYSNVMIKLADALSEPEYGGLRNKAASSVLRAAGNDPTALAKKAAFLKFIILNPIRQALLQSQQLTVYAGLDKTLPYMFGGGFVRDYAQLAAGLVTRWQPDLWLATRKNIANARGITEQEVQLSIDAFRKSGMIQGIDSHDFLTAFANDPRRIDRSNSAAWDGMKKGFMNTVRISRRLGFDFGEITQLMGAFLVSKNRWMKNNPKLADKWADDINLANITADAREISLSMNRGDASRFQRGGMGLMFQFMSHTTKSLQMLFPTGTRFGSKWLNNREKARIALLQSLVYGPIGAFGINRTYEAMVAQAGIEVPPEATKIVEEGMAGYSINMLAAALDEEGELQSDIEFSQSFSPFAGTGGGFAAVLEAGSKLGRSIGLDLMDIPIPESGTFAIRASNPVTKILEALTLTKPDAFEFFFGAAGSASTEVLDRIKQAAFILGEGARGELPEDANAYALALDEMLKVLPIYSANISAIAADKHGSFVDGKGRITTEASHGEIYARSWLGLRSRRETQQSEFNRQFTPPLIHTVEGMKSSLEQAARTMYDRNMRLVRQLNDGEIDIDLFFKLTYREMQALRDSVYPEQWMYMMTSMRSRILSDLSSDGQTPKMIKALESALGSGVIDPGSSAVTRVKNMAPFTGQAELIKIMETLFNARREQ